MGTIRAFIRAHLMIWEQSEHLLGLNICYPHVHENLTY